MTKIARNIKMAKKTTSPDFLSEKFRGVGLVLSFSRGAQLLGQASRSLFTSWAVGLSRLGNLA